MPAEELAAKFSDFRSMQSKLDNMTADERSRVGDVQFTQDAIVINTPQVGAISMKAVERAADHLVLEAQGSPVPMKIVVEYAPVDDANTEVVGKMEVEIPAMLRPLVGPALQKAVDQFGNLFAQLA